MIGAHAGVLERERGALRPTGPRPTRAGPAPPWGMSMRHLVWTALATLLAAAAFASDPRLEVRNQSLAFESQCLDLDTGIVSMPCAGPVDLQPQWDIVIAYHSERSHHAVVLGNAPNGVAIATLEGRSFEQVDPRDIDGAHFRVDRTALRSARPDTVYLVRTDRGATYKLGRVSEAGSSVSVDYALLIPAESAD